MQLNNHIGIFENALSHEQCDALIQLFKHHDTLGTTFSRSEIDKEPKHYAEDQTLFLFDHVNIIANTPLVKPVVDSLFGCYAQYADYYSTLRTVKAQTIYNIRVQRTRVGEGFHAWHQERTNRETLSRIAAFIFYLNDVEDGGETEFLHLALRVKPKKGTLIIWPAGYTHAHRGNPPLTGEKFIATGWIDLA